MSTGITGYVDFTYEGETYQTWYRVFGDLKATNVTPVVALHGSPGISHHSMLPNGELYETHGIPVIVYDQIGIGKSTHLTDKPRSIWTPKIFMDELDDILEKLGIASNFDLIGHSWGGMLASEYAGSRRPKGLRHLVIVSSLPSMKLWEDELRKLLEKYPEDMRRTIEKHEQENTTDHPDYQKAMRVFYAKHLCQLDPWPQEMVDAVAALTEDPVIYSTMIGRGEFTVTGTLKNWDITSLLPNITSPTLLINGVDDKSIDVITGVFFKNIPKSKWVQFGKSSHTAMFEDSEKYLRVVGDSLANDWMLCVRNDRGFLALCLPSFCGGKEILLYPIFV